MNTADSAEEIVKIYLEGVEMSLRVTGVAAKNIAMMLIAMSKEKKMTRGKTRLTNMLKTGKPLKIFTISADELKKFSQEAKKYGILYCALANKNNSKIDGMVDIMIKEEDAGKMNRIAERFNFKDVATIKKAQNDINAQILSDVYGWATLNDFYDLLNLPHTDIGDKLGWDLDNRMEIHISAQVTENGEPCLVIGHDNPPKYLGDY